MENPEISADDSAGSRWPRDGRRPLDALTNRELEVLRLLMRGRRTTGIARFLGISPNTVRTHIQRVLAKLGVRTRAEAVAVGFAEGLAPHIEPAASTDTLEVVRLLMVGEQGLLWAEMQAAASQRSDVRLAMRIVDMAGMESTRASYRPDVLVVQDRLARASQAERACLAVKRSGADVPRVLVVGDHDRDALVRLLLAGADGYVSATLGAAAVVDAVRRVHAGDLVVPSSMLAEVVRGLVTHVSDVRQAYGSIVRLTPREHEVLQLLVRGCDREAITVTLGVSPHTVRTHIQRVLGKLGVHSQLEVLALGVRLGLTEHHNGSRQGI